MELPFHTAGLTAGVPSEQITQGDSPRQGRQGPPGLPLMVLVLGGRGGLGGHIVKNVLLRINLVCWIKMLKIKPYVISFVKT